MFTLKFLFHCLFVLFMIHPMVMHINPFLTFILSNFFTYFHYSMSTWIYIPSNKGLSQRNISYISCNFTKSVFLAALSFYGFNVLLEYENLKENNINYIKNLGAIYSALDTSALFYNKKMSSSTIFHHVVVFIFFFINLFSDYNSESIVNIILYYAIFSSFTFFINYLLAIRFIKDITPESYRNSAILYGIILCINWMYHFQYFSNVSFKLIEHSIMLLLLSIVAFDDIMLIKWCISQ